MHGMLIAPCHVHMLYTLCLHACQHQRRAALELFKVDENDFKQSQLQHLGTASQEQLDDWKAKNDQLHQDVEVGAMLCSAAVCWRSTAKGFVHLHANKYRHSTTGMVSPRHMLTRYAEPTRHARRLAERSSAST